MHPSRPTFVSLRLASDMKRHTRILLLLRHKSPCMTARQQRESLENQVLLCVRMEKEEEEEEEDKKEEEKEEKKEEEEEEAHKGR